jgi:hypothetical protein
MARWLAIAIAALLAASCAGSVSAGRDAGSRAVWLTYTQPPGPMHLVFAYPSQWTASGTTWSP